MNWVVLQWVVLQCGCLHLCAHTSSSTPLFLGTWVIFAWEIPGLGRSPGEGNSNPLQYSCVEFHGQRSLVGYSPWGCKELNLTEWLTHTGCFHVFSSVTQSCQTLQTHGLQHTRLSCPSPTPGACSNSWPLSRWCHPTITFCRPLPFLPSIFPSIKVFSSDSVLCIRWPKYWSFSFSICPSNEYSGLISFRIDRLDLLAVQGTLKSLVQHHSSKASILWCSAFFMLTSTHDFWKNQL